MFLSFTNRAHDIETIEEFRMEKIIDERKGRGREGQEKRDEGEIRSR